MSTEIIPSLAEFDSVTNLSSTVATSAAETSANESDIIPTSTNSEGELGIMDASALNSTVIDNLYSEYSLFETFIIIEIVMTSVELFISIIAAIKMPRWRRNFRNQMLMQLTFARFIKRVIFTFKFLEDHGKVTPTELITNILNGFQIYIDFVIVILVFFFIKHMYYSLIIVLVKISHNSFYRVLTCSWLLPVGISAMWTTFILTELMDKWHVYLVICCVFRWPLIFVGTGLYITIVYRVLSDKIRQFARSLAVVTFLLCLIINIYLFSKDVIELWCSKSFASLLISYISGLLMNFLILILYAILIFLTYSNKIQSSRSLPDYSLADVNKCKDVL